MSAFLCSPKHIAALATFANNNGFCETQLEAAKILCQENVASVAHRYPDTAPNVSEHWLYLDMDDYIWQAGAACPLPSAHVRKLAESYQYQSCEHPGWESSGARELTNRIITEAAATQKLRDVHTAPWSI
jgi:hypothetical protein